MGDYYDRDGLPMTLMEWAKSYEARADKKRVAETTLPDGTWISTVWLGLNHQYGEGPPLIFETMVFQSHDDLTEREMERYSTEAEAIAGHAAMVAKLTTGAPAPEEQSDEAHDGVAPAGSGSRESRTTAGAATAALGAPTGEEARDVNQHARSLRNG